MEASGIAEEWKWSSDQMNRKAKGSRNEHKSIKLLESLGYNCTRSSASLGVFDVIGVSATDVVLLQVKTRDWPSSVEMESIKMFPSPPNSRKIIHRWKDRQSLPDVREI